MTHPITSVDHSGRACTLCYAGTGTPVDRYSVHRDFRGEQHQVIGGRAPHKPGSTGRVETEIGVFFPSVLNMEWIPDYQEPGGLLT